VGWIITHEAIIQEKFVIHLHLKRKAEGSLLVGVCNIITYVFDKLAH